MTEPHEDAARAEQLTLELRHVAWAIWQATGDRGWDRAPAVARVAWSAMNRQWAATLLDDHSYGATPEEAARAEIKTRARQLAALPGGALRQALDAMAAVYEQAGGVWWEVIG